jgi:hypothetical protein
MPTDGSAFRNIKERWPIFKEDPCNFSLSLATDGVNPFGDAQVYLLSVAYFCYKQ